MSGIIIVADLSVEIVSAEEILIADAECFVLEAVSWTEGIALARSIGFGTGWGVEIGCGAGACAG